MTSGRYFSVFRLIMMLVMAAATLAFDVALYFLGIINHGRLFLVLFISLGFLAIILLSLEIDRIRADYTDEKLYGFGRICVCFVICLALMAVGIAFKFYAAPISIAAAVFVILTNKTNGLFISLFYSLVYYMVLFPHYMYLLYYFAICIVTCIIATFFEERRHYIAGTAVFICMHLGLLIVLEYSVMGIISDENMIIGGINGVAVSIFAVIAAEYSRKYIFKKCEEKIKAMCDPSSSLLNKLKEKDVKVYNHCVRTALVAGNGAKVIDADANLAASGALYYKIGKLLDDDSSRNNRLIAERHNFPRKLNKVILQAGAKREELPDSREAAIVVLAGACVGAIEKSYETQNRANWSKEIIIQQIFNAKSAEGVLESSGVTMKMYIELKDSFSKTIDMIKFEKTGE